MTRSACAWLIAGLVGGVGPASAQPAGGLERPQIVDTITQGTNLGPLNLCADLTGQFGARARVVVAPDGVVSSSDVATTDKPFAKCVREKLARMRFAPTRHGGSFGIEIGFRGVYPTVVTRPIPLADVGPDPCEPVGVLVAEALADATASSLARFDDALALHARLPACRGDRGRTLQRAITKACRVGDAAKAASYARRVPTIWLEPMYACRDAKVALPKRPPTGSLHVAHGADAQWLEVAIDGENYGSPPINAGHLPAGRHEVEIWDAKSNTTRRSTVRVLANRHVHLDEALRTR